MSSFSSRFRPTPVNSGFRQDGYWVWCGSALAEPGRGYHLYAARWPKTHSMFEGYIFLSEIVHAFSPTLLGPYRFVDRVLPGGDASRWDGRMAHNPTVHAYGGRYLLYYIASTYDGPAPNREEAISDQRRRNQVYQNIKIGLAIADSPDGPWQNLDAPILLPRPGRWDSQIVTNPAPCVLPDGRIFLYYRSNTPQGLRIGLAVAQRPEGPYERVQDDPVLQGFNVEDPYVWHNGRHFEMIAKDITGDICGEIFAGAHFHSDDGISWRPAPSPRAYSRLVSYDDGSQAQLGCLERPQLLFGPDGEPQAFFAAAADGPGSFRKADNTWNIAIPMAPAAPNCPH